MIHIQVQPPSNRPVPVVVCDRCGEVIDSIRLAGLLWIDAGEHTIGQMIPAQILCKVNQCLRRAIEQHRGRASWRELEEVMCTFLPLEQHSGEEPAWVRGEES